ncbi:methyl-accepting chemotaxis protein [Ramlibacter sp. MMS24-I3-19]|uniref:methyl-accepting chemotaxis protein n=1 Tax=Ramlibacter sp. MMS24-I3-19 TaxID=3416606 RepID=UPI003CFCC9A4
MKNVSIFGKLAFLVLLVPLSLAGLILVFLEAPEPARLPGAVAIAVLTSVATTWLCFLIHRSRIAVIRAVSGVIARVSQGDLSTRATIAASGETARLLGGLHDMTLGLRSLTSEVAQSARTVAASSAQIAEGNLLLSRRTEEQAATLEETASSMEELTSTVNHNAEHANEASKLAEEASENARKGAGVVDEVVTTMDEILDASKKISDIISVINAIAFQTNILALNAAVEAARAGEQGRGFAVVATEVRALAQRTTAAAKEIKELIAQAEQTVRAGADRVDTAGHTMVGVVLSVDKVRTLIAEIAAASQEQSAGIGQVNTAVSQMEHVVQQNASMVEEASGATKALSEQAQGLLELVSRFRLGDAPGQQPDATSRPKAPAADAKRSTIKVRAAQLPPAYAAAVAVATRSGKPDASKGSWEQF